MNTHTPLRLRLCSLAILCAIGCGDTPPELPRPDTRPLEAKLTPAASCDDLLARLKADARAHIDLDAWVGFEGRPTGGVPIFSPGGFQDAGAFTGSPTTAAEDSASGGTPRGHTETNVQVEGVDEADFVETDGNKIYLLHGDELFILDAWPPSETAISAIADIEGTTRGMFVAGGKAVVVSEIYGYYGEPIGYDGGTGDSDGGDPVAYDGGGAPSEDGSVVTPSEDGGMPTTGDAEVDPIPLPYPTPSFQGPRTKITVIDVASATPTVLSERWLEGSYVDARRHGDDVRVLVSSYASSYGAIGFPSLYADSGRPFAESAALRTVSSWREDALARIEASTLTDFLPEMEARVGGEVVAIEDDCTSFLLPQAGVVESGMLRIASVRMSDASAFETTTIVGRADTVYANVDTLVVAQNDYRFRELFGMTEQEAALHVFELAGGSTTYSASGKIAGVISDQFALDVDEDVLRAAITQDRVVGDVDPSTFVGWVQTTPVTYVATFGIAHGQFDGLGRTQDLAPGERMQSVRFIDDRAYVVTFLRVDPLFVVDLSNPTAPTLLAELEIPGFSEYVHPLAPGYLLTIGRQVDPATGSDAGFALSIFDVRDDLHPALLHKRVMQGSSSAEWDHHDFIFDDAKGILAIPAYDYIDGYETELALFSVRIDTGIAELGRIDHTPFFSDCAVDESMPWMSYGCVYPASVRRGLFIDDYIYSVSYRGVLVHALSDLVSSVAQVPLPEPTPFYGPWYGVAEF